MGSDPDHFKIETAHNRIDLRRHRGRLELRSADKALQSALDLRHPERLVLENLQYLLAIQLFVPPPQRILLLGTAAGSILHYLRSHFPRSDITAVDIDAELIERLLQLEILPPAGSGLTYVLDDAARFIGRCHDRYDLVLVDIFSSAHSPAWVFEKKTTDNLYRLLSPAGALAYNLIFGSETLFNRFYRELRLVFERRTLCLPVANLENTIVYAFRYPVPARDMAWYRQRALDLGARDQADYLRILAAIYNTNPVGAGVI